MLTMLSKKYGNSTTIVFDGYGEGPSTKDSAHLRRSGGVVGVEVKFVGSMRLKLKKNTSWLIAETSRNSFSWSVKSSNTVDFKPFMH